MTENNSGENLKGMNILITGGAGFIASHLADELVNYAKKIVLFDNLSTGFLENINHLLKNSKDRVRFIKGDLRDFKTCLNITKSIDIVFHLGAQINPVKAVEDPFYDFAVNAMGTLNMLEASHRNGVNKFIYASTNIYGDPKYLPIDENHPINLLSPYAASKLSGEAYCIVYNNSYNLNTVRLRFTNVYGPRQRSIKSKSGVISIFLERALNKKPLIIFGDGNQTRDFVYVSDVVNALIKAAENENASGEVFNIGWGVETSVIELARMIIELVDKKLKIIYGKPRAADFKRCKIDISKAKNLLGYKPKVGLKEGLIKTIEWYKSSRLKH